MTHLVEFTQYLRPHGTKKSLTFVVDADTAAKAARIRDEGYVFEIEVLTTGQVSATISDPILEEDAAMRVGPNDESLPKAVLEMIAEFEPVPAVEREKEVDDEREPRGL